MNHAELLKQVHAAHRRVASWRNNDPNAGDCPDTRIIFYFELLNRFNSLRPGIRLLDAAGGLSWFAAMAVDLGLETILIDDFGGGGGLDRQTAQETRAILGRMSARGIRVHEMDFLVNPLPVESESIDIATCFHSLEHWHNTPKPLFAELQRVIKRGAYLLLATPNAVNLRKRISVMMGKSNLPSLREWYEEPVFRGHVREPVIADLCELLEWNHFAVRGVWGRNFIGWDGQSLAFIPPGLRGLVAKASGLLRLTPSLCSDIHVIGQKQ